MDLYFPIMPELIKGNFIMKKLILAGALVFAGLVCFAFIGMARANNNITVYYSPTCPHCHHALEYINNELIPKNPQISVSEINVTENENNLKKFKRAVKKCGFESGGVPIIVIGEKCWQGYSDTVRDEMTGIIIAQISDK